MKSFKRLFVWICFFSFNASVVAQKNVLPDFITPYEKSNFISTATYDETVNWYRKIQQSFPKQSELFSIGKSDAGNSIYVFHLKSSGNYKLDGIRPVRVLINNNIHPGEPEGTDASMLFVRELLTQYNLNDIVRKNLDIYIVLQYNVDGTIRRGPSSRANQNGPVEYGFRATANNLDLNRDFIKCDSKNTQALEQFVSHNAFDFFIDNHTSNGADYQYALTYFHTVTEKLPENLIPAMLTVDSSITASLLKRGWPTVPYVNTLQEVPDSGLSAFYDSPRFATGWAAAHGIIGFTVETHMLKPFHLRVDATKVFLEEFVKTVSQIDINRSLRQSKNPQILSKLQYTLYKLNTSKFETLPFLGYQFGYKPSGISGQPRLYYDRNKPITISVKYFGHFQPIDSVQLPTYYIIPQSRTDVVDRLNWNHVKLLPIQKDSLWKLKVSYIVAFQTVKDPYEGHYLHHDVTTRDTILSIQIHKGDWLLPVGSEDAHFLSVVLEPKSPDSYFCWNFFDDILQQKEGYSAYVFEDLAVEFLSKHDEVKRKLAERKLVDPEFARNGAAQLDFIYKNSPYYEQSHRLYPIFRSLD